MLELWAHQKEGVKKALDTGSFAFFWEMGVGKTRAAIEVIRHRCAGEKRLLKVLILGPKAILHNWKREFAMHSKIPQDSILVLDQKGPRRLLKFREATIKEDKLQKPLIVITNYESMQMKDLVRALDEWAPEILVCDESHKLKNHESKRAKIVIQLSKDVKWKYLLTGTPILNSPMDVFNQFLVLDGGATFGKNFWAFRNQWFEDENAAWSGRPNHFPKFVPRPTTFKSFNSLIYKKAMRVIKSECLDLPPLVREEIAVDLSQEQAKLYRDMRDEYIAYIDSPEMKEKPRAVVAQLAITKALRLQQIISGFAKPEDGVIYVIKENPRLKALEELLEELTPSHKVIVWATFHENYKAISEVCRSKGIIYTEYHGLVPQSEREENLNRFRTASDCRVMIANQASGGVGINMTEASYSIFYSRNFSLEADLQAEARNYRGGSEMHTKVTRIDLVAKGTIDELISEALMHKQNMAEQILDWKDKL